MKLSDKENFYLNVVFVDNHLLVVEKPFNMSTQMTNNKATSLEELAKNWIKDKFNKKQNVFLHSIHRLDTETLGLVIFARTSKALTRLNKQMRERKIIKKYIAEIEGFLDIKKGELKDYIVHLSHMAKIVKNDQKNAKLAHLSYKVLKEKKDTSLIEIDLLTGRYHQIRAQFANLGHSIVGDRKYQSQRKQKSQNEKTKNNHIEKTKSKQRSKKINLCCFLLEFMHPIQKDEKSKKVLKFQIKPSFFSV